MYLSVSVEMVWTLYCSGGHVASVPQWRGCDHCTSVEEVWLPVAPVTLYGGGAAYVPVSLSGGGVTSVSHLRRCGLCTCESQWRWCDLCTSVEEVWPL